MLGSTKFDCPILTEHNLYILPTYFDEIFRELSKYIHSIDLQNFIQLFSKLIYCQNKNGISSIGTQCRILFVVGPNQAPQSKIKWWNFCWRLTLGSGLWTEGKSFVAAKSQIQALCEFQCFTQQRVVYYMWSWRTFVNHLWHDLLCLPGSTLVFTAGYSLVLIIKEWWNERLSVMM